jgi:hypothetical protein
MRLTIKETVNREIIHYAEDGMCISSQYDRVYIQKDGLETVIQLPGDGWKKLFGLTRLGRRLLRLDKCNVAPVRDGLVIIRQGIVYHFNNSEQRLTATLKLMNCRNILHQSLLVTDLGEIFFGEYGNKTSRSEVPVYRSSDSGKTWETVFTFPAGKIKHIHGCYWDPFEKKIWVFTGDFSGECHALCTDRDFKRIEWIGDGQQTFRMCNAFFEPDSIHWIMDSQLEDSYHVRLDRRTREVQKIALFPGPVWYIKRLTDGFFLAATTQEIGPGVKDEYSHLLISRDLYHWEDCLQIRHDGFPKRLFKFGVLAFADGLQSSRGFYIFGEALKKMDGKSILCQITA